MKNFALTIILLLFYILGVLSGCVLTTVYAQAPATLESYEIVNYVQEYETIELEVLYDYSAKTYMSYKAITNKASPQWKYIHKSGEITVGDDGYLRTKDDFIGVALGSYFGTIGDKFIFTLEDDKQFKAVIVEAKADEHTDSNGYYTLHDTSIIEFVVDTSKMQSKKYKNGYIYGGNFNNAEEFKGKIIRIERMVQDEK